MLATRTPADAGSAPSICAWNTTWRALYGWPSGPATDSALARLLATTFRRWLCALTAEPETLNTLNSDMSVLRNTQSGAGTGRVILQTHRRDATSKSQR